jgi:hypothetical protein
MIIKPSISFVQKDGDAQLLTDTQTILTAMTGNPAYPSPNPTLATVTTGMNDFATALANAANAGTAATVIKNQKRAALEALLRELATYVHAACQGNLAVLISSGYPIQKPVRTPVGVLPAPATPVLSLGARSGELNAWTNPVPNGYTYNWRAALASAPDIYVLQTQTTAASDVLAGLTPGQIYLVDVNVVGSAGPSDWSDTVQLMVVDRRP